MKTSEERFEEWVIEIEATRWKIFGGLRVSHELDQQEEDAFKSAWDHQETFWSQRYSELEKKFKAMEQCLEYIYLQGKIQGASDDVKCLANEAMVALANLTEREKD